MSNSEPSAIVLQGIPCIGGLYISFDSNGENGSGRALTVREVGALSDLDNVTVRVADVAAYLAVLGNRLRDELGPSTFP